MSRRSEYKPSNVPPPLSRGGGGALSMRIAPKEMGSLPASGVRTSYAYDVAVAYRICPKVSKPAEGLPFGDDKLRQAEVCLRSFRESLGSLRVKLCAILDGCPAAYGRLFRRYFSPEHLVVHEFDRIGNRATYEKQLDFLRKMIISTLPANFRACSGSFAPGKMWSL